MTACRFPFQHDPQDCDCRPDPLSIAIRNAELNERARKAKTREDRKLLAGIGIIAFIASLGFLVAAHSGLSRVEQQYQADARR